MHWTKTYGDGHISSQRFRSYVSEREIIELFGGTILLFPGQEAIADPWLRHNELGLCRIFLQFFAKMSNIHP